VLCTGVRTQGKEEWRPGGKPPRAQNEERQLHLRSSRGQGERRRAHLRKTVPLTIYKGNPSTFRNGVDARTTQDDRTRTSILKSGEGTAPISVWLGNFKKTAGGGVYSTRRIRTEKKISSRTPPPAVESLGFRREEEWEENFALKREKGTKTGGEKNELTAGVPNALRRKKTSTPLY